MRSQIEVIRLHQCL